MKKKKLIAMLLAAIMLAGNAVSCSDKDSDESQKESQGGAESVSDSVAEEEDTGTTYFSDMEAVDYEGWELRIASISDAHWYCNRIVVDEYGVDEFYDTLYERQIAVEDKYKIKIVAEDFNDALQTMRQSVQAQMGDLSLAYDIISGEISMFTDNIAIGVSDMPVFDLDKPYWDKGAIETLSLNGKMYYGLSDLGFGHYESNMLMYYNGVLLKEHGLSSPYDLYMDGKWTTDAMYEMLVEVSNDTNGDGKMVEGEDTFGFVGRAHDLQVILAASDCQLLKWNTEENTMNVRLSDEHIIKIGEATKKLFLDGNLSRTEDYTLGGDAQTMFKSGKALFFSALLGGFRTLRDEESDYGIINFPAIEENTKGKSYCTNPEGFFIASDSEDPTRLATIIEAMNAYAYDRILDSYIERTVVGKGARDMQSAEIIRENFSARQYDLAQAFGLSFVVSGWRTAVMKDSYASMQEKMEKIVNTSIRKTLDNLE